MFVKTLKQSHANYNYQEKNCRENKRNLERYPEKYHLN